MNKKAKILLASNVVTLLLLGGVLVKEHYPQKILAKFKKQETANESKKITYWLNRQGIFEALPRDSNSIIFVGTSLTENFELTELFRNYNIKNRGITADRTEGVLNRLTPIIADHPKKVFIEVGVNDLGKGIPKEILIANYNRILDTLMMKCPNAALYIQSILPVSNTGTYPTYNRPEVNADIQQVNAELMAIAGKRKITYIDLYSKFVLNGEINPEYVIADGIHLTGAGYLLWTEILRTYLQE